MKRNRLGNPLLHFGLGVVAGILWSNRFRRLRPSLWSPAQPIDNPQTLEDELDQLAAGIAATLLSEGAENEAIAFRRAHRAWEAYRDAEVGALYPPDQDHSEVATIRMNDLRAELAGERLRHLRAWWE